MRDIFLLKSDVTKELNKGLSIISSCILFAFQVPGAPKAYCKNGRYIAQQSTLVGAKTNHHSEIR